MQNKLIYNRISDKLSSKNRAHDKGFTLVELIVVLALMAIMLSVTIFGGLAWQDYARFNHEEATAEDIFFAVQNQLTELDASGALENKVIKVLQDSDSEYISTYVLASAQGKKDKLESIIYESGSSEDEKLTYSWNNIWKAFFKKNSSTNQKGTIITLYAKSGDYDRYLADIAGLPYDGELGDDAKLLFSLVAPYISDTSVLNGCINLEFSPEAGQVFSVCYSDVASAFDYNTETSGGTVNISDRRIQVRKDNMVGYYSVDQLYEKLKGKEEYDSNLRFEINGGNIFELIVHDNLGDVLKVDDTLSFELFEGDTGASENVAMSFTVKYKDSSHPNKDLLVGKGYKDGLLAAVQHPTPVDITFGMGELSGKTVSFSLPIWTDEDGDIHIVLDAADIEAQSYAYYKAYIVPGDKNPVDIENFRNTYSFYRFGLSDSVHYLYGKVYHTDKDETGIYSKRSGLKSSDNPDGRVDHRECPDSETGVVGECTTFDRYTSGATKEIEIANARHLYNMRYETDYKKNTSVVNKFKLTANIDWNEFVGKGDDSLPNYFVSSYDVSTSSGIGLSVSSEYTKNWPFPGFRCLGKNDVFTQDKAEGDEITQQEIDAGIGSYSISNLTISITSNIRYGIYDNVFFDPENVFGYAEAEKESLASIKSDCISKDDFTGITGLKGNGQSGSSDSKLARAGRLPLGLFAENLGEISNITLDKHIVRGMETVGSDNNIIYTCMVGGFAGNNMGTVSKLTLLDSAKDEKGTNNNKTRINGRTDVGGIIGRQSFSVSQNTTVTLKDLKNEGTVTGYENVGGIVGRAYVHYVDDKDNDSQLSAYDKNNGGIKGSKHDEKLRPRYDYYHDGYSITDDGLSITGLHVYRTSKVIIEECENKGKVSGDPMIYDTANGYMFDGIDLSNKNNIVSKYTHCAFIGGIAGITQDGYIIDDSTEKITSGLTLTLYKDNNYYNGNSNKLPYISIKDCKSEILYDKTEINAMKSDFSDGKSKSQDCYVGGLIGYARLTYISDCGNDDADSKEYFANSKVPLVMGRNYVGGLVGCSDESLFKTEKSRGYYAVNNNLVIGERYVGGIAGGFGVGDVKKSTFSFKEPAKNEASQPSFIDLNPKEVTDRKKLNIKLCNKGIVLGVKNPRNLNYIAEKDEQDGTAGIKNDNLGSGMIGGIVGANHLPIMDSDNIQSKTTKKYALNLIGFSDEQINDFDNVTKETAEKVERESAFGGTCVGGISGSVMRYGYINRGTIGNKKTNSYINAVVFGQDYIGGGVGLTSETGWTDSFNFFPISDNYSESLDGMIVVGRDCVGGLIGDIRAKYNFDNDKNDNPIDSPYTVYGRYAVGGAYGIINTNYGNGNGVTAIINLNDSDHKVQINGIAYVGGLAGICMHETPYFRSNNKVGANVSDVTVNGKYFAGGLFGAYDGSVVKTKDDKDKYIGPMKWNSDGHDCTKVSLSRVSVKSDIFGGGFIGLYSVGTNTRRCFESLDTNYTPDGKLYQVAESLKNGSEYVEYDEAFVKIVNSDVYNQDIFATSDASLNFTLTEGYKNNVNVTSKLFAGGVFGYVPEKQRLTVSNITNEASLAATESVGGEGGKQVSESANGEDTFAYLGGIIGRAPRGMVITNCTNTAKGSDMNSTSYYSAPKATYLGGLTEVNAGVIKECTNDTEYTYGSGGVGAFAGVNGTDVTSIKYSGTGENIGVDVSSDAINNIKTSGLIYTCTNNANLESTDGFVGGMTAADGGLKTLVEGKRNSAIYNCVNLGNLVGKDTAGMVAKPSGTEIISKCRNYGLNQAKETHYGIAGGTVGNIAKNLEAGGLSRNDTISDPVAPMNSENLVRNFYISDTIKESELDKTPSLVNVSEVYFDLTTDSGNDLMEDLLLKYYNQTDKNPQTSDKLRIMSKDPSYSSDFAITYKVKGGLENTGLKMNSFNFVWSNGESATEQTYVYDVTFKYVDSDGATQETAPAKRVITQNDVTVTDTIDIPDEIKGCGITEISIRANVDDLLKPEYNPGSSVTLPYYYAYWTDSNNKHFIWDALHIEKVGTDDGVYFYSKAKRTTATSEAESGSDDDHPAVYNLQPAIEKPKNDDELSSKFNLIDISYDDSKTIYDNNIMLESPSAGLDMDYFRIYWLYLNDQSIQYKYTVAFTYLDDAYNPQTIYYDRVINPMSNTNLDDPECIESGNWHRYDCLCYDEIPVQSKDGKSIKPVNIEIYVDGGTESFQYYYSAMTWGKYIKDDSDNITGRVERTIADETNKYSLNDPVNGLVDLDSVAAAEYTECSHDTANEAVRFVYNGDRWSKQLTCVKQNNGYYNLVFSKGGVYQRDNNNALIKLLPENPPITSDLNSATPQEKHDILDDWFIHSFVDNTSTYPNSMFVESN